MNRKILTIILIISLTIFTFLLWPRKVQQALVVNTNKDSVVLYVEGNLKKIKCKNFSHNRYSVINLDYNFFGIFNIKEVSPLSERIMIKNDNSFELEHSGNLFLSSKTFFYYIDKNNNVSLVDSNKIIVGKNNIKSYPDHDNNLKTFVLTPMDFSNMRVGINDSSYTNLIHKTIQLKCLQTSLLYNYETNINLQIEKNSIIIISNNNNNLQFVINGKNYNLKGRTYIKGNGLCIENIQRGEPTFNPLYNGVLEFTYGKGGINLINETNTEDYLTKVVPSEMPNTGGLESLKCQAVAARTYAISDMLANRYSNFGFYVDDSTQSQVYNNCQPNSLSNEAVLATKGEIMTYASKPIDAKFYSTSAGTGVSYDDVWFSKSVPKNSEPYLTYHSFLPDKEPLPINEKGWLDFYKNTNIKTIDDVSPYYRWKVTFSEEYINTCLKQTLPLLFGSHNDLVKVYVNNKPQKNMPVLTNLTDIKVINRSKGGNLIEVSFIFNNVNINVKSEYYIRSALRCKNIPISRYNSDVLLNSTFLPSGFFSFEKNKNIYTFYGGGYGHGVGMSQYGAMEMSKKGIDYKTILNYFYSNITFEKY